MSELPPRSARLADLAEGPFEQPLDLYGWVEAVRDHGGLAFLLLRDHSGRLQVVASSEVLTQAPRREAVVRVRGSLRRRAEGRADSDLETGAVELVLDELEVLSEPTRDLAFSPGNPGAVGEDVLLRDRVLALRGPELQGRLRFRAKLLSRLRRSLEDQDFLEVETPALTRSTPEGARDFLVPSRRGGGQVYALPQSPQLFKQMMMVAGWDRYYQVCRCFRDEDLRADRQPEFTQLDIEASFLEPERLFELVEGAFRDLAAAFPELRLPATPFPRMAYAEAMATYGTDAPDLRYDLPIQDLSEALSDPALARFAEIAGGGAKLRVLCIPSQAGLGRKALERLQQLGESGGHKAQWLRHRDGEYSSSARALLGDQGMQVLFQAAGASPGDLVFFKASLGVAAARDLGLIRRELGRRDVDETQPHRMLWVTDFPWAERDPQTGRWMAKHHPFTQPVAEDLENQVPPGELRARAYDLVMDGVEVGGGSVRIHDPEVQRRMFQLLGIDAEEAQQRFGFLLDALALAAPPHLGMALGIDRLVALLTGATSLRDVIAFPKSADGTCALTGAPSPAGVEELLDLGLRRIQGGDH